ncbi:hypothetical protein [Umezawaea sp. Da 62-37]|uniref:hypothetical protein n=1 Tax=Umezawaea sp. Da 62-37 TaxID=3075927 RepID=UPI0028F6F3B3|nr:hypothetical protein [Umezawaea sp. Da 62-37]WNV90362.1 hypothetical protein RM788_19400 [Umezawaea sp. Da 62-37]
MTLDKVRVLLPKRRKNWVIKDAVWQEFVRRAHTSPELWITVAVAMMMPGLKHIGGRWRAESNDRLSNSVTDLPDRPNLTRRLDITRSSLGRWPSSAITCSTTAP